MTGTTYDVKYAASAWPQLGSKAIAEAIQKNIDTVGVPKWTDEEQKFARDFQKFAEKPEVGLKTQPVPLGGVDPDRVAADFGRNAGLVELGHDLARPLRDLHPQVERGGAGAGVQYPRRPV